MISPVCNRRQPWLESAPSGSSGHGPPTDWRFSTEHSRRIVRHLEGAGLPTSFREIHSPWGHDSFLLEVEQYHETVRAFLDRAGEEIA